MKINDILKKRTIYFCLSSCFIMIFLICTGIVIMKNSSMQRKVNQQGNNLQVYYQKENNILEIPPKSMTKEDGRVNSPSNIIKIVNKKDFSIQFFLRLKKENGTYQDIQNYYFSINDSEPSLIATVPNGTILTRKIEPNEEFILDVKAWLNEKINQTSRETIQFEVLEY